MKKLVLSLLLFPLLLPTQSSAEDKQLWAKSFLNQKAPELIVEEWLTEKPNTEGKFVLVDFWATWCGPCRKAIPHLNGYQKTFKDQLVVIGISNEPAKTVRGFKQPKIEYASAIDTQSRTKKAVGVTGIPHVMLIDPKGIVRWEGFPYLEGHELTEDVIKTLLEKYKE